jgi:hypothetical protein
MGAKVVASLGAAGRCGLYNVQNASGEIIWYDLSEAEAEEKRKELDGAPVVQKDESPTVTTEPSTVTTEPPRKDA